MGNKKDNRYYLDKILIDLKFITDHTKDKTLEEISSNEILIDSIMFRIIQVAESNNYLTDDFKEQHKEAPWTAIRGMRNKIVHDYSIINMAIVYDTVKNGIPEMYAILSKI
ncbi:MAG: DUF86 domain-containing protein [Bacilli bacterium]|jgi:uncharacterized protein with HEPN domain